MCTEEMKFPIKLEMISFTLNILLKIWVHGIKSKLREIEFIQVQIYIISKEKDTNIIKIFKGPLFNHAACVLGDHMYIYGGKQTSSKITNNFL
jgi:hypothetical protein